MAIGNDSFKLQDKHDVGEPHISHANSCSFKAPDVGKERKQSLIEMAGVPWLGAGLAPTLQRSKSLYQGMDVIVSYFFFIPLTGDSQHNGGKKKKKLL